MIFSPLFHFNCCLSVNSNAENGDDDEDAPMEGETSGQDEFNLENYDEDGKL